MRQRLTLAAMLCSCAKAAPELPPGTYLARIDQTCVHLMQLQTLAMQLSAPPVPVPGSVPGAVPVPGSATDAQERSSCYNALTADLLFDTDLQVLLMQADPGATDPRFQPLRAIRVKLDPLQARPCGAPASPPLAPAAISANLKQLITVEGDAVQACNAAAGLGPRTWTPRATSCRR